jgi:hypothetical protein
MRIPTIIGTIDRRILINYQADKEVVEKFLPAPFRPKLVKEKAIVGICLIRLTNIRPKGLPSVIGISSENGAHRIAVEWTENGQAKEGVYVPRRDTSSRLNTLVGGRVFPGVHHLADFSVKEGDGRYDIEFKSDDGTFLSITAQETNDWSQVSVFDDKDCASDFFKNGSVGYSPTKAGETFEGLELTTKNWEVSPLTVSHVESSFFADKRIFPEGSVTFDNALLMKSIDHEWRSKKSL